MALGGSAEHQCCVQEASACVGLYLRVRLHCATLADARSLHIGAIPAIVVWIHQANLKQRKWHRGHGLELWKEPAFLHSFAQLESRIPGVAAGIDKDDLVWLFRAYDKLRLVGNHTLSNHVIVLEEANGCAPRRMHPLESCREMASTMLLC